MFYRGGARDGQHDGRALQKPGERNLVDGRVLRFRSRLEYVRLQSAHPADWRPRHEAETFLVTISDGVVPLAVVEIVTVLDGDDRQHLARARYFFRRNFRKTDMPDLASIARFLDRDIRLLHGD